MRRRFDALRFAAFALTFALAVTGCTSSKSSSHATPSASRSSQAACPAAATNLVNAVQHYVDAYGTPLTASGNSSAAVTPDDQTLQAAVRSAESTVKSAGCKLDEFRSSLDQGLAGVTTKGPVARAVLLRLTASMTGTAKQSPTTATAGPHDDLARKLADLAPGSTLKLSAGTFTLDTTLVLMQGVTIKGAGRDRTVVRSTAPDAGLIVLTDGRVELGNLTFSHTGKTTGDVLVGGATSSLVLTGVRVNGAQGKNSVGGNGVLMTSRAGARSRGTTLEVTDSTFDHNATSGITLTGPHAASVRGARFEANGQCGVCFSGTSTGAVRTSTFVGNRVGIAVLDQAKPALTSDTFTGGLIAIQASNASTPVVQAAQVDGATRAAMIFADTSSGRVDNSSCSNVAAGIVVAPKAAPLLGTNSCSLARGK